MPERVDAEVQRLLGLDSAIVVRYTDAITPDSFSLSYRSLYLHSSHREAIEAIWAARRQEGEAP
ncbi:chemotaxis protein CheY [Microbacterium sp. BG28]|uniref:chemotaxis protein CheY n=1 Tax=Microbacterium sp. BG28 TaxID=3097356 RepID=UPI002A5AEE7B|nr:chemotaxis protein CheY [Microbacterium sp. BG28]MDY0827568.1 chemotaxis protein CheY [Microbacterium sp. BG28]